MFIKLLVDLKATETKKGREKIQNIISTIQVCVYKTRGSLNKFLLDDKGSVILCCWGLPPFSTSDDSVRAVYSGNLILKELKEKYDVVALIGITTGSCFTGVCGSSGGRREYSLLGEVVNLSARYMQTAIEIYVTQKESPDYAEHIGKKTMFLCEKTKYLIQNKIFSEFRYRSKLKGFSVEFDHFSPIDEGKIKKFNIDNIYQLIKTHRNNKFNDKNRINFEQEMISEKIIGLNKEKDLIMEKFDNVAKKRISEGLLIRGIIGSGKSFLLRNQLIEIMKKNKEGLIMQNIDNILFISNQSPITHSIRMNAYQEMMRKICSSILEKNIGKNKTEYLYGLISSSKCKKLLRYITEILGQDLKKYYNEENETPQLDPTMLTLAGDPFFSPQNYEQNINDLNLLANFFINLVIEYQKIVLQNNYPIIIVTEDTQQFDGLSVAFSIELLKKFKTKEIKNIFFIGTFQTQITDLKDTEKEKFIMLNKELNEAFTKYGTVIDMKPFVVFEDVANLIKENIKYYRPDVDDEQLKMEMLNKAREDIRDNFIRVNIDTIPEDVIKSILPLCIKGSPLFIIELTQALIAQGYLLVKNGHQLELSETFKTMMRLRDYRQIKIPIIIEKVLGNIIDALKCIEIIILKQASVIGNIFDIDILGDLMSSFSTTFDDLLDAIKNFESLGIIEILYDIKLKHLVAMFSLPLMREVLYQRLLVEQRTEIHSRVARKMEFSKYSYMPKEIEYEILRKHLESSENTMMNILEEDKNGKIIDRVNGNLVNRKILITKQIIEKLKIVDLKITSSYHEIKKQFMPMLLDATIIKKDEHGGKTEQRYAVLTNKKFCYYYEEKNYNDNSEPLASFFLKDIYQITILSRDQFDEKNFYLEIKVSSWYKKSELKEDRDFIIGFKTLEEMSKWEIALNFLRIKNMYDEFTSNFGMIQLPLSNEFSLIDCKKYKRKLNIRPRDYKLNTQMTKSISGDESESKKNLSGKYNKFINKNRKKTISNNSLIPDQEKEKVEKKNLNLVDINAKEIFKNGFGLFIAHIQESIKTQVVDYSKVPEHINKNYEEFMDDVNSLKG